MEEGENKSESMWLGERKVLATLLEHPYADPFWLGEYLGSHAYTTAALQSLKRRGYAQGFQFTREDLALKRVWTITPEGVNALARLRGMRQSVIAQTHAYNRGRMTWMVLALERVTRLRWFMKNLEGYNRPSVGRRSALSLKPVAVIVSPAWKWQVIEWHEEIELVGKVKKRNLRARFDGAATLAHREDGGWLQVLVHFDDPNLPVKAYYNRFTNWLETQQDARFFDDQGSLRFPVLAVIAQNAYRLNDYAVLIREIARKKKGRLPNIYLALDEQVKAARGNPAQPIWSNAIVEGNKIFLADERGWLDKQPNAKWRPAAARVKSKKPVCILPASSSEVECPELDEVAGMALGLKDTDHRLVRLIASHPLLSSDEIEQLTNRCQSQISSSLRRLSEQHIVESKIVPSFKMMREPAEVEIDKRKMQRKRETKYHLATELGERYLAAVDGFGTALERYRLVKLWSPDQTKRLVREWSHTRAANMLFIKLITTARAHGFGLEWLAETESRLYFTVNGKRHSFVPDGHGMFRIRDNIFHFVVEIDTARSNAEKMRGKIARYYMSAVDRILKENPNESISILIITHSSERMSHLSDIAREVAERMDPMHLSLLRSAPVFFGQIQVVVNPRANVDRPIWTDLEGQRVYCFEEFRPLPPKPNTMRTGEVTYKS